MMTVRIPPANGAAPETAGLVLDGVDDGTDHGPWAAGDGAPWKHRSKGRGCIDGQRRTDVRDQVLDGGVGFNIVSAEHEQNRVG